MAGTRERSVSEATMRRLELATGGVAGAGVAEMSARLPWFSRLTADQRAGVLMVTQLGAANFVTWLRDPDATPRLTAEAFRSAPPDLARRMTLRQTVELVRIATEVFEERIPALAGSRTERATLVASVLRFGREVAFAAATVYASAAESRGAWDARLEALVVDALVRGERSDELPGRAAALGWATMSPVLVLVGAAPTGTDPHSAVRRAARSLRCEVLVGVHAEQLVVVLGGHDDLEAVAERVSDEFGPGPVVMGPVVDGLSLAGESAAAALAGLRAVRAWPGAPRPVHADALLAERALDGDPTARAALSERVALPLQGAGGEVLETVRAVLASGGNLEATARSLFVHPNTVRYRLRRAAELTGLSATDARGAWTLQIALALSRLDGERSLWH
jgi:DNA-binding PucR family transcriptional regulator